MEWDKEKLSDFVYNELRFCGCGDTEAVLKWLYILLKVIARRYDDGRGITKRSPNHRRMAKLLGNEKDIYTHLPCFILYHLNGVDLIEHGSTVQGSWITTKGKEFIAAMDKHGFDMDTWNDDE